MSAGFDRKAMADNGATRAGGGKIMLTKAYLVLTKESWGCLGGQAIVADVTGDLTAPEGKPVLFTEIKNSEDVDNRLELYLFYPAREIGGLAGSFVLRLGVAGPEAQTPGTLRLAEAALVPDAHGLGFQLRAKISGQLKPDLLYAGDTQLASGLFTCSAAGLFDAHPTKFLQVYPVHTELPATAETIDSQWDNVTIPLEDFQLKEAAAVATCYGFLTGMEKEFSASNEHHFLWDQSKLVSDRLGSIASSFEKSQNYRLHVSIELRDRKGKTEIQRGPTPFLPQLRQMIAARNARGKITGGSVLIAVEKFDPN